MKQAAGVCRLLRWFGLPERYTTCGPVRSLRALVLLAALSLLPAHAPVHAQSGPQAPAAPTQVDVVTPDPALSAALGTLKAEQAILRSGPLVPVLQALYRGNGLRPLWIQGQLPTLSAGTVHAALMAASLHGLDAEDYRARWIGERLAAARDRSVEGGATPAVVSELAELDLTLTLALLRYLADVHNGRASARQIAGVWTKAKAFPDSSTLLDAVPRPAQLQKLIADAAPAYPMYGRLLKARATYEALIAARREAPRLALQGKIEPGDSSDLVPAIAARMIELGDLAASAYPLLESMSSSASPQRYEGALVEAVERFQGRHGLAADGVVGKGTLAAMQAPNRQRMRQIDLALERLRWLPPLTADRIIGINIPEFTLWAYARDPEEGGQMKLVLQSRVVVGRQGRTPTPVFIASMNRVDFAPYWNVPISIARAETLPRLRRDPGYLASQNLEFVAADGRTVLHDVTAANLAAVQRGAMRIRQRPGDKNALGKVKFTMPNSMNIYLHDTPSRSLFSQSKRDFSHGCIRVEKPFELAQYALADDPAWEDAAIAQAMESDTLRVVNLARQIPVVVFYTTATVDDSGTLRFLPDIYGYDEKLNAAMPPAP